MNLAGCIVEELLNGRDVPHPMRLTPGNVRRGANDGGLR
jgi:hypothetical protein